jgi:hypothetical protein
MIFVKHVLIGGILLSLLAIGCDSTPPDTGVKGTGKAPDVNKGAKPSGKAMPGIPRPPDPPP